MRSISNSWESYTSNGFLLLAINQVESQPINNATKSWQLIQCAFFCRKYLGSLINQLYNIWSFLIIEYLDNLLEKSLNTHKTELFIQSNAKEDIICPDENGLSFNFGKSSLRDLVSLIANVKIEREVLYKVLDLYLYAKSYISSGKYYISLDEETLFYEGHKKKLRDALIKYVFDNSIDMENELKDILDKGRTSSPVQLSELSRLLKN